MLRHVLSALDRGEPVSDEKWSDLEFARYNLTLESASQRAGRLTGDDGVSQHARACHNLALSPNC